MNRTDRFVCVSRATCTTSPFEQFLNQYKATHPEVDRQQMEGRALLWDKFPMQGNTTDEPYGQVRLRQPGYVYYSGDE